MGVGGASGAPRLYTESESLESGHKPEKEAGCLGVLGEHHCTVSCYSVLGVVRISSVRGH